MCTLLNMLGFWWWVAVEQRKLHSLTGIHRAIRGRIRLWEELLHRGNLVNTEQNPRKHVGHCNRR